MLQLPSSLCYCINNKDWATELTHIIFHETFMAETQTYSKNFNG